MLQLRGEQGTVVTHGNTRNSIEHAKRAIQNREGIPANQQRVVFEVPAKVEERVETAVEKAAAAAKAAQAAAKETEQLEQKLARLREIKAQKAAAAKRNANTRAAENAQRAATAAVKAAEKAVEAAGVIEKKRVTVACGDLAAAAVDIQQLFGSAVQPSEPTKHLPTKSVTLDLNDTLKFADSMARSAATLEQLNATCPLPTFPTLPKLGLTLPKLFGDRTATAAPPPPPPSGPGYTFAGLLPRWPGHGGPPHVPQRAEPPQVAMLLAAAAPAKPPTNENPATLRLRLRTAHGFHKDDEGSVAAAAGNQANNFFKPANDSLKGIKGTQNVGGIGARVKARAAGAGEGGGTRRRRRRRHRGTRRH
jgi:hypothetical protein